MKLSGFVIHWDVYGDGGEEPEFSMGDEPSLCTNPLFWTVTTDRIEAGENVGRCNINGGDPSPSGQTFDEVHHTPITNHSWAQCRDGLWYVADQSENELFNTTIGSRADKSYHGLDFQWFHMDVRENAQVRVDRYDTLISQKAKASACIRQIRGI
jgi:hypothetical protein